MMTGSPAANVAADKPRSMPNLKGTMVGVAPPDLSGAVSGGAKPAAAPPAKLAAGLKGTMVGVAPPGLEDLKKQAAASKVAAQPAGPPANLKGTMIGLAPPNMGAEVEAAKARLAAKKAESAETQITPPQNSAAAAPNPGAASKGPPSKLKGTMIGLAPPDMQAQIAAAKQALTAQKVDSPSPEVPAQETEPPSEPDPLGGTVVGTSPFSVSREQSASSGSGVVDFNDDTPPAGSGIPHATPEVLVDSAALTEGLEMAAPMPNFASAPEPAPYSAALGQVESLPIKKSSAGPMVIVMILLLIVAAGVGFLLLGGDKDSGEADDAAGAATEAAPAPTEN